MNFGFVSHFAYWLPLSLLAVLVGVAASAGGVAPGDDPLPLLRIALAPEQVAPQLARLKQGVLVKLPREDFEARVQKAARAAAPKNVARVVRADYRAELSGQDLTGGRGEWVVLNSGPGPAVLPLAPLSLALSRCAWEGGGEAIVGDLDGKGLGAWAETTGLASLVFDWSCRGTPTPQGLTFDLRLPAAPQTTLALELPADAWPTLPARAGLLTGPHDAGTAGKKLWRIQLAGKTQVELIIRRLQPGQPPTLFVQTQGRQLITPDRVAADYEFQIEVPRGAVRELTFEGDGTLEPFEVIARSADLHWRWDAPARPAKGKPGGPPGTLVVEFRTPQQGLISGLRVRCLAPRPAAPAEWVSPALRLRQAVGRSETLRLQFHPDVHLGRWFGGDFHLAGSATESDGGLTLNLVDTRAAAGGPASARPRCQLLTGGAEFMTVQHTRWHVEPGATALRCAITYDVARGQLHQLAVKLSPVGGPYHVESVAVEPKGLLRNWALAGQVLLVELDHAVTPRTSARLSMHLRSALGVLKGPTTLAVPDVVPLDASLRQGTLAIALDSLFHAQLVQSSVPPQSGLPSPQGGAPAEAAAFTFAYRDQPLSATLRLFPQQPEIQVHSRQEIVLGPGAGRWQARVEVEPLLGRPAALDVYLSAALSGPWQVRAEGQPALVHHWERLPVQESLPHLLMLGLGSAPGRAALQMGLPRGQLWRVHFTQPLALKATLLFEGSFRPPALPILARRLPLALPGPSPWNALAGIAWLSRVRATPALAWDVPVLCVPGVAEQEGEVVLRPGEQRIESVTGHGLEEVARFPTGAGSDATEGLFYRLGAGTSSFPSLELRTRPGQGRSGADAVCESSELTTRLEGDGSLVHRLRVRLRNWREPRFTVVVPDVVKALAAKIDGSWLAQVEAAPSAQGTRLSLPVRAGAAVQEVELLYASRPEGGTGPLVRALTAPEPQLPLAPLTQAQYWRLPPGWVPWDGGRIRPRGQPEGIRDRRALSALPGKLWHAGEAYLAPWHDASPAWLDEQRSVLLAAEAKLRAQIGQGITLGDAVERLAAAVKEQMLVVIDAEGLRAAGTRPEAVLPVGGAANGAPFWVGVGLVFLPCPSAPLLTTPQRVREWQACAGDDAVIGAVLDPGIAEAAAYGLDHAGCFASSAYWLRVAPPKAAPASPAEDVRRLFALFSGPPDAEWTEWEPLPGLPADATLALFHAPTWRWLGYLAAGLWLACAGWVLRRVSGPAFFRLHLLAAGLLAAAVVWSPAPLRDLLAVPLLLAELLVFAVAFTARAWPRRGTAPARKSTMVRPAGAALVLMLAVLPLAAQVAPAGTEPALVYLVAGPEPGTEFALVTPELLKKLDAMASRVADTPTGAVVVSARYQGKAKDGRAEFEARFDLYHFADQSTFVLPLTGVQLQPGVFLDGAPVFPVAHKNGYALPLRGKGAKRLTLTFQVRPAAVSDFQELRFGVPKAGQADFELSRVAPAKGMHLATGLGAQTLQHAAKGGDTLRAQLGYEGLVQVRWSAAPGLTAPKDVTIREAYYWDLRPSTLGLTAAIQLGVTQGGLPQVRFALPEGLEVRAVELIRPASPPTVLAAATIRQWEIVGNGPGRQLVVDFAQPVAGNLTLRIEIVPRLALTPGSWLLRLPAPLFGTATEGLLAYRLDGNDAVPSPQNLSVGTPSTELLAWAARALRDAPALTKAHSFRRKATAAALSLAVQPVRAAAQLDLLWKVGPRDADLAARVALNGGEDLALVELELPPRFKLAAISGDPVHHWSRQDRLVQIWLRQAHQHVRLAVHGWIDLGKPGPIPRFDVAPVRVLNVRSAAAAIVLEPAAGITLRQDRVHNLTPIAKGGTHRYTSANPDYSASFTLRPADAVHATGRAFTLVERRGAGVEMTTALHLPARAGPVEVKVTGWASDLRLEVPAPIERKAYRRQGAEQRWSLVFPPGLPRIVTLTLRGRIPALRTAEKWALPVVAVAPITLEDHWIGLDGVELADKDGLTLKPIAGLSEGPAAFAGPPRTLGTGVRVGRLKDPHGGLELRVPASVAAAPAQILLAQHDTFWGGAGWVHQLRLLAFSHGRGALGVRLPQGAACRAVAVADQVFVPGQGELEIPLPGAPGPRTVQVCWTYPSGEAPDTPRLDRPSVVGLAAGDCQGCLWLPAAYQLTAMPAGFTERSAAEPLRRAEARLRLCALWAAAGASPKDLRREQQAFRADIEQARAALALLNRASASNDIAKLSHRAEQLDQDNARQAKEEGYAVGRPGGSAGQLVCLLPLAKSGLPLCWNLGNPFPPGPVALASALAEEAAFARSAMELVVLAVVALLLLSYLRRGLKLLRAFWPEAIVALTGLGSAVGGLSPFAVALLGIAIAMRAAWLVLILRGWIAGPADRRGGEPGLMQPPPSTG